MIEHFYNQRTRNAVENFFENIVLPAPIDVRRSRDMLFDGGEPIEQEKPEYTWTRDEGILVLLNKFGSVIRFTPDKAYSHIVHPHIMQPLFSRHCGPLRTDIFPGVTSPITPDDRDKLRSFLRADNIDFNDPSNDNAGYLPYKTTTFPNGVPVIIDTGSCELLTENVEMVKSKIDEAARNKEEISSIQNEIYGSLTQAFATAWPQGRAVSDKSAMAQAWALCVEMKKQGILIDDWNAEHMDDFRNLQEIGKRYDQRLQHVPNAS